MRSAEPAVRIRDLSKSFGDVRALDHLSLDIPTGTVFALVGPDGAGKSTLIRILCGLITADTGTLDVLGMDAAASRTELRRRTGYLSQRFSLYGDLSIDENLAFAAEIFGVSDYQRKRDELLEMTSLMPFRRRLADRLSGGMRQKLALAATLIHEPRLILLDEPTNGVDPVSRREFWKLLRGLGGQGITLLMSTPYLDEAERADNVAILHEGRLLIQGVPGRIRDDWDRVLHEFFCDRNRDAASLLARLYPEGESQAFGDRVHLALSADGPDTGVIAGRLESGGIRVRRQGTVRPGLENVYLAEVRERTDD